jgi:hypothetical protein
MLVILNLGVICQNRRYMMCNLIKENTLFVGDNKITFQNNIKNIIEINDIVIVQIWNTSTGDIQNQPFNS